MHISVVVPAFNEEKLISASLRSVIAAMDAFRRVGWGTELIVCDNNSTDRTAELALSAGAKVVFEPFNQIARARNTGAAAAQGDWLVFVDADSRPSVELFTDLVRHISTGRYMAGGCTLSLDESGFWATCGSQTWNFVSRARKWCAGSFIFCQTAAFKELGGFSLELFASEEIEFSKRAKKLASRQGKKLVILHRHPLVTSARKVSLYSRLEYFRFFKKAIFSPNATLKNREACHPWYDGRR
jgi:glycosyltransferase involved in cell wall biosynthesis